MANTRSAATIPGPAATAPPRPGPPQQGGAGRSRKRWSTPRRLWAGLVATVLSVLLLAAAAAATVQGEVSSARKTSGPVEAQAVNVQELYFALADADAAAATGILDSPAPPVRFTTRYQSDITQADDALAASAVDVAGDKNASGQLQLLEEQLSEYTGLIGTAQANNRQGFPVGGAYLREASNLLENTMLPEAQSILATETDARASSATDSGGVAYLPLIAALLVLAAGVFTWRLLSETTRRTVNAGLALALLGAVLVLGWTEAASHSARTRMTTASADFDLVAASQQARSDVAQISADEASSVVSQGADNGKAAQNGDGALKDLGGQLGLVEAANSGVGDQALLNQITAQVATIKKDASTGDYSGATTAMVGSGDADGGLLVPLDSLAGLLATSEHGFQAQYQKDSSAAEGVYVGGPWPLVLVGLLAAVAAAYGVNRRIAEYR